eukprot:scaffold107838_cov44-Prasinocladus_malaysianus.AAC.2
MEDVYSGNGPVDVQGYLPTSLYCLDTPYGSEKELRRLIKAAHRRGIKCVADIVINHRCATGQDDGGRWNRFQEEPCWDQHAITCDSHEYGGWGAASTGSLYAAAPNIDHTQPEVRRDYTLWLRWLRNNVGFDGWRLDFVLGYDGSYAEEYIRYGPKEASELQKNRIHIDATVRRYTLILGHVGHAHVHKRAHASNKRMLRPLPGVLAPKNQKIFELGPGKVNVRPQFKKLPVGGDANSVMARCNNWKTKGRNWKGFSNLGESNSDAKLAFGEFWDTCRYDHGVLAYDQSDHRQRTVACNSCHKCPYDNNLIHGENVLMAEQSM